MDLQSTIAITLGEAKKQAKINVEQFRSNAVALMNQAFIEYVKRYNDAQSNRWLVKEGIVKPKYITCSDEDLLKEYIPVKDFPKKMFKFYHEMVFKPHSIFAVEDVRYCSTPYYVDFAQDILTIDRPDTTTLNMTLKDYWSLFD